MIAYQVGAGHTGEWVKGNGSMASVCGDYSRPMQKHFRAWLRQTYHDDLQALQNAWAMPGVSFDTAEVPPTGKQLYTTRITFRDPQREQWVIDYYRCLADLCANLVIDFCKTVKKATNSQALAGAFFGYLMELAWNSGFFGEGIESPYSTYQRSGHLGLRKVLQSDLSISWSALTAMVSAVLAVKGRVCSLPESVRLHGKLYIFEEDSRTHLSWHDHTNYGKTDTLEDSIAVLKRNFSYILTHGHGIWWLAGGGPKSQRGGGCPAGRRKASSTKPCAMA